MGWLVSLSLLSPLLIFAKRGYMPLPALFGVAGGILLALILVGRRLYDVMMFDGLSGGRKATGSFFLTVGLMLLAALFVLLGAAVAVFFSLRGGVTPPPI